VLGLVVVYLHAIVGFLYFREDLIVDDHPICDDMLMCFISFISYGYDMTAGKLNFLYFLDFEVEEVSAT
jgi:hypothetical protein